jgi:hypothetical protein
MRDMAALTPAKKQAAYRARHKAAEQSRPDASRGQFSNVCVGTSLSPLSLGTGSTDFATICIADCGNRAKTCCGPVKSSCVNSGKMTKPTLKSDMLGSIRLEA